MLTEGDLTDNAEVRELQSEFPDYSIYWTGQSGASGPGCSTVVAVQGGVAVFRELNVPALRRSLTDAEPT